MGCRFCRGKGEHRTCARPVMKRIPCAVYSSALREKGAPNRTRAAAIAAGGFYWPEHSCCGWLNWGECGGLVMPRWSC
eukprot:2197152-Rhodomonas_salina.1